MNPTLRSTASVPGTAVVRGPVPPGRARRAAIAGAGLLACALPTVFTVNITRMLLVGELSEHRLHQLTGQGLLLFALWLGGLVPLLRAGWTGARPSTAAGIVHLVFIATGCVCSVAAPGGGAPILTGVIAVTGALVWLAIPVRPQLRLEVRLHPLLTPVALAAAAVATPYVLDQLALQNAATGYHAQNPHYFDMAWLVSTLAVLGLAAAVLPSVRALALLAGAGLGWTGTMGLVLDSDRGWMTTAVVAGAALLASTALLGERHETAAVGRSLL